MFDLFAASEATAWSITGILVIIYIATILFTLFMLINVIKNDKLTGLYKFVWAMGMILFTPLAIVYYFTEHTRINKDKHIQA